MKYRIITGDQTMGEEYIGWVEADNATVARQRAAIQERQILFPAHEPPLKFRVEVTQ